MLFQRGWPRLARMVGGEALEGSLATLRIVNAGGLLWMFAIGLASSWFRPCWGSSGLRRFVWCHGRRTSRRPTRMTSTNNLESFAVRAARRLARGLLGSGVAARSVHPLHTLGRRGRRRRVRSSTHLLWPHRSPFVIATCPRQGCATTCCSPDLVLTVRECQLPHQSLD